MTPAEDLSPRVVAVLSGAAQGETIAETARRLHVSPKCVDVHRRTAMVRLGARNTTHAVVIAIYRGYIA